MGVPPSALKKATYDVNDGADETTRAHCEKAVCGVLAMGLHPRELNRVMPKRNLRRV